MRDNFKRRNRIVFFGIRDASNDVDASSDVETIKSLADELGIENVEIKKTFRIKAKQRINKWLPFPLNVEFHCEEDKYAFLNKSIREKLRNLSEENIFHGVTIAPDRSFKEREEYRLLRQEMNTRNEDLKSSGTLNYKWIIKKMSLIRVEVEQDD